MRFALTIAVLSLALGTAPIAPAGEWDVSGFVGVELRYFPESPAFADQDDTTASPSGLVQLEVRYEWNEGDTWSVLSVHLPPIYCVRFGP